VQCPNAFMLEAVSDAAFLRNHHQNLPLASMHEIVSGL
jgi:hypothetical protein